LLTLDKLGKAYGGRTIFDNVSWSMPDDGRVGLVGLNGAGKSTLLRMIAGLVEPDSGRITRPQRTRVGYLAQDAPEMSGTSVLSETLSALAEMRALDVRRVELEEILAHEHSGPLHESAMTEFGDVLSELERHDFYTAESRAEAVLTGLGFKTEDLSRDVAEFSGGIRMRIALAKLLLQKPEFMMLDEPTNHLDLEARNWLEDYLADYGGGIILVSHDHYFLDRVTRRTAEVTRGGLIDYNGNYSYYLAERERRVEAELAAYEKQRTEIEHMEAFISRFRYQASKAKLVQSRIKQLEKVERLQPPAGLDKPPSIAFPDCERSARRVVELTGAVKRYGDQTVYSGIDIAIERGARIALVGPNGAGKSTMIRMLAGIEEMTAGTRFVGDRVGIGYFAQNLSDSLDYSMTVLEELSRDAQGMTTSQIRGLLGAMLFSGDEVNKRVGVLSGGERARLALAKVLAHPNNFMLLDEPTNNLDIVAKQTLLEALQRFPGTVVLVSHDRHILNQLVTQVIEVGHGSAVRYLGNYDEYLEKKATEETTATRTPGIGALKAEPAVMLPANGHKQAHAAVLPPEAKAALSRNGAERGRAGSNGATRSTSRTDDRQRARTTRRRTEIESSIEDKEKARAELALLMNDPQFYLTRKDADDLIARYERLGREIDQLYEELVSCEDGAATR
jgi:ATP-binding cassette, subfamily F, member 3